MEALPDISVLDFSKIKDTPEEPPGQIIVKFYTPDSRVFTQTHPTNCTVSMLKQQFEELFGIPYDNIFVLYKEDVIPDKTKLGKLKADEFGILELKVLSDNIHYKINVDNVYPKDLTVPDILTVRIETENEEEKEVVVEIENSAIEKPILGGFRHICSGVKYLHGYSQTGPAPPKVPPWMKNHRDTQTYFTRNRKTETEYARATQMANKDIYIMNGADKILTSGPYETADEREKRLDIEGKVRTIQRYYRAWKIRMCLKKLSAEYHKRMQLQWEREERERLADEERRKRDIVSKVFPLTNADFSMLYTMTERWKNAELARISSVHCGPSKIAEFYLLLDKEVEIFRSIENVRNKVAKDLEVARILEFFKSIGQPIEWYSDYKNLHIIMDTLETQKGREYFALYKKITEKNIGTEDRIKAYADVKEYLNDHLCEESEDIIRLIDRVCQLLARGIQKRHLAVLEKRIEQMVIHHFRLTECNEGVTNHMKHVMEKKMRKSMLYCSRCQKLKTIEMFSLNARMDKVKICTSCKWLDKVEEPWIDLSPYRFILKLIRNYERLHHAASSVAFILQDKDIHHIIINIWHGHSALSECNDIYQLRLCRWKVNEEWAPWNCILLTVEEAKAHMRVEKLETVYEEEFINHIFNKHALARMHFSQLMSYDKHFTDLAKGDPRLDENSEFYNKPVHDCLFGPIEDLKADEHPELRNKPIHNCSCGPIDFQFI